MVDKVGLVWLIVMSLINILAAVAMIDKPRKPLTRTVAAGLILWSLLYIAFFVHLLVVLS